MKRLAITALLSLIVCSLPFAWLSITGQGRKAALSYLPGKAAVSKLSSNTLKKLQTKAKEARSFTAVNNYNENYCFLIDMRLPSGQNRFFVFDLKKDTILNSGLVTHGRCNEEWLEGRRYGNRVGCGCTSLGKYKVGNAYHGRFGLAFKLYGLEKTNDKAFQRYVVLHSHDCVPAAELDGDICQSDGCPTVSPPFLKQLEPLIKNSGKPVLLWIFE
jgi:hypothetical protein